MVDLSGPIWVHRILSFAPARGLKAAQQGLPFEVNIDIVREVGNIDLYSRSRSFFPSSPFNHRRAQYGLRPEQADAAHQYKEM
jgi:hypothetical protein